MLPEGRQWYGGLPLLLICACRPERRVVRLDTIETFAVAPPTGIGGSFWVLVRVTTDDGVQGVGECYGIPFAPPVACAMVEDVFDRYLAGEQPQRIETMFRRVYSAGFTQRPDPTMMSVFSGIETAAWDILGKARGVPLYELLGGRFHSAVAHLHLPLSPRQVHERDGGPMTATATTIPMRQLRELSDYVSRRMDCASSRTLTGPYSFQGGRELSLHELDRSVRNVAAIRAAVGNTADILFGTHGQMTTSSAIRLARRTRTLRSAVVRRAGAS